MMETGAIIRAWKDNEYRLSLTGHEQSLIPAHPAGLICLIEDELSEAVGGVIHTLVSCPISVTLVTWVFNCIPSE